MEWGGTKRVNGSAAIEWNSPNIYGNQFRSGESDFLRVGLYHVRAANDIEIEYSGERDGWVVFMRTTVDAEGREERREKAFIPAWDEDEWEEEEL